MNKWIVAFHEAAHSVITYRTTESAEAVSVVPQPEHGSDGHAIDGSSDSENEQHMEGRILSLYAGGHAQREVDASCGSDGCTDDDEQAADLLSERGWKHCEEELRARSLALVRKHWLEIAAVADELMRVETLDEREVELIADGVDGDAEARDRLKRYRLLRSWLP